MVDDAGLRKRGPAAFWAFAIAASTMSRLHAFAFVAASVSVRCIPPARELQQRGSGDMFDGTGGPQRSDYRIRLTRGLSNSSKPAA